MEHQTSIYTICYFLLLMPILACSQADTNSVNGIDIKQEVKRLKNFNDEPIYQIRINTPYSYTILINGIPIANKKVPYLRNYFPEINTCNPRSEERRVGKECVSTCS